MHHNQTREGLERHIKILTRFEELEASGFLGNRSAAARQISRETGIGETSVYGTLYNHQGKLERFKNELRVLGVENVAGQESGVDKIQSRWNDLLVIISTSGYSMEDEWYEGVANRLGLSGTEELQGMLDILFEKDYLRKFEVSDEDGGDPGVFYLVAGRGKMVAKGEKRIELEDQGGDEPEELVAEAGADVVNTKGDFFAVMDYVLSKTGVPTFVLDHQLMRKDLNMSVEKMEAIVSSLIGGGYLVVEDEKLTIAEGIVRPHGGDWPIEFASPESEVAYESSVEAEEGGATADDAEVIVEAQEESVEQTEVGEIDNLQRLLKYIEGPGAIRLMERSFEMLERALGISEAERKVLLREAETSGFLEDNGRAALAITGAGRKYLETKSSGSAESNNSENKPSGRLLAAE